MMNTTKNRAECMNDGGYWSGSKCWGNAQATGSSGGSESQPQ